MARLEALLAPVPDGETLRGILAQLAHQMGGTFSWLDDRNASIGLTRGPEDLVVRVLEEALAGLQAAAPAAVVRFRSAWRGPRKLIQALLPVLPELEQAGVAVVAIGIGNEAGRERFCGFTVCRRKGWWWRRSRRCTELTVSIRDRRFRSGPGGTCF